MHANIWSAPGKEAAPTDILHDARKEKELKIRLFYSQIEMLRLCLCLCLSACLAERSLFRRVPWEVQLSCDRVWTKNPTLKFGNTSLVAGRDKSLGPSSSVVQLLHQDRLVWCRRFSSVRVVSAWLGEKLDHVILFLSALKGQQPAEEGSVFAIDETDKLPVLFVARLNMATGKTLSVKKLAASGHYTSPVGLARRLDNASVVHVMVWGNDFLNTSCIGPNPFVHTLVLGDQELQIERVCFDWACDSLRHCNATEGTLPAKEPVFGEERLSGVGLAAVVVALISIMLISAVGALC